ncbi:MAG: hypothetical protein WBE26_18755 [Phycisphaerae bacterium]
MTARMPGSEHNRTRNAVICLAIGFLLVLWAWGSWSYRTSVAHRESVAVRVEPSEHAPDRAKIVRALPLFLLVALLLVLVFLLGSYVLVRATRRYRQSVNRRRAAPSPIEDVWAMHKLPGEANSGECEPHDHSP